MKNILQSLLYNKVKHNFLQYCSNEIKFPGTLIPNSNEIRYFGLVTNMLSKMLFVCDIITRNNEKPLNT